MKTKIILTVLLLITGFSVTAQTIFKGVVVDAQSKQPITNAKIGITNQGVGVVSNASGAYIYKKYQETLSDTDRLIISAPGYDTIELEAKEVRTLLNRNSTTQLEKSSKTKAVGKIKNVKIFWDISEGMQDRNLEQELATVQKYLDGLGDISVTLDVFNNKVIATEKWKNWDGDMARFRESVTQTTYDGPSNYSILRFDGADAAILVSNGEPNYGKLAVSQGQPVYSISSTQTTEGLDYLESLSLYTSGSVLRLKDNSDQQVGSTTAVTATSTKNIIEGKITSLGEPVSGATLMVNGDLAEYSTNSEGVFKIPASSGDILFVRALGLFPKKVLASINDLNIDLIPSSDQLDEVVITEKREKIIVGNKEMRGLKVPNVPGGVTPSGDFYITADDIEPNAKTLDQILREKFAGITLSQDPYNGPTILINGRSPSWVLNGVLLRFQPPPLYLSDNEIESIVVKEPGYETSRYGELLSGDAIIVTTKSAPLARAKRVNSALVRGNDYTETVPSINSIKNIISGTVVGPKGPIQGAEVLRKGSFEMTTTASDGSFKLNAKEGDVLLVTALGTFSKTVAVTDQKEYAINVLANKDYLDEVVVTGETRKLPKTQAQEIFRYGPELETGRYKLKGFGSFNVTTITKDDFKFEIQPDMGQALSGRFESVYVYTDPTKQNYGRPYILRGAFEQPLQLFIDGQLELGTVYQVNPSEVISISIKSDMTGIFNPALLIDTNRSGIVRNPESLLAKNNHYKEEVADISNNALQITGIITSSKGPVNGATITKKGTFNEVRSTITGSFSINASLGDVLVISTSGMFPKEILIENQDLGTIKLTPKTNDLDAIVLEGQERVDNTVQTADGKINADKLGYTAETLEGNDFSSGYTNLRQLITGKVAGVDVAGGLYSGSEVVYKIRGGTQSINTEKPPIWIINGTPYQDVPNFLDVQQIKSITVLKSTVATSRYGSLAAGGAFLIKTKEADFKNKAAASNQSALVSGNEYTGDVTGDIDAALPSYIIRFRESGTPQQQLALYKKLSRTQESPLEYYVDAAQYFQTLDPELGSEVRSDLAYIARNNTKALRTLSYLYELVNDFENVVLINERIVKIAPQESQSYRDLALAYQNNKQYDKALELYINMLGEQIMGVNFDGLENPLRSELSRLVALYKDKIDYSRLPNEWLRADFKRDIRMVIDWSDRSVPFEFQFVNPDKKFFKWTHTLEETRERLEIEQKQGFQTEEFIIDDAPSGEWIINIQYLGDEGDYALPPFLKYTVYRNYGTPQETKEIRVIKLFKQVDKVTLGRLTM